MCVDLFMCDCMCLYVSMCGCVAIPSFTITIIIHTMHTCCRLYLILVNDGNIRENVNPIALKTFIQLFVVDYNLPFFSNSSLWYIKAKCLYNVLFFIILYHVYPYILCIFDIKLPVHLYFSL